MNKLYLLDGMSIAFRVYYGLQRTAFTNKTGLPTGAVVGFVNVITLLLEKLNPEHIAVVFDCREPTFRHKLYSEYKANRKEFPEELGLQLPYIKDFIKAAGIKCIEMPGFEADDIIGTLARKASEQGWLTYCFTADKDFLQLLDERTFIIKNKQTIDFEIIGINDVKEHFGVNADEIIDYLALIGDASDNIPGVKGIGEKTAIPLIEQYHSIENIYANLNNIEKERTRKLLLANKDNAFLSKKLATIDRYVELDCDNLDKDIFNSEKLTALFNELGFKQIYERWRKLGYIKNNAETIKKENNLTTFSSALMPINLDNSKKALEVFANCKDLAILIETDTSNRDTANITGVTFCSSPDKVYYLPLTTNKKEHSIIDDNLFSVSDEVSLGIDTSALAVLKEILENKNINKIGYEIKDTAYLLNKYDIYLSPITFDVKVAGFLLDTNNNLSLASLTAKYLDFTSDNNINIYERVNLIYRLYGVMLAKLLTDNLLYVANNIEFPLIEVLANMELTGISIDVDKLSQVSNELTTKITEYRKLIFEESKIEFNIDSPKQLGDILFNQMGLSATKKTKTGYSTDVETLTEIALLHPIAGYVLEYRKLVKLKNTYIDALPKLINPKTNKIHTTFNQTIANTGRLSSTEPNLQNIPIRTEAGKEIRAAFVPTSSDFVIMSADYSQIELRVMAYLSKDENLINAFNSGIDIHSATASLLYGIDVNEVNNEMRRIAKTVNFGIMYGLGAFGLSQRLQIPRNSASTIINNYFLKFPGIKKYINDTLDFVRQNGYTETMTGRKRYFPDINHKNHNIRAANERAAINMPVQGSAADMIKIAMLNIYKLMKEQSFNSKMLLQVHDELVFEVVQNELDTIKKLVNKQMISAFPLANVPLEVSIGVGNNWLEAHN